ncbi:hypothetical protein AZI87_16040 [Bdellovibrio bacteriovorus]|uniref:Uncharacterized protein n=1 Tax=Bdellovibrio bacteriovorus TaxID=959 RepID=A0A162FYJ8_BDEBC|nr:hypothetical protein [Bdellovibrio bacteriovorus]KYG62785.1 hypothetical protein AZI87_16040 [Bdellovibrio bacteriovorus]
MIQKICITLLFAISCQAFATHGGSHSIRLNFADAARSSEETPQWKEGFGGDFNEIDVINLIAATRSTLIGFSDEISRDLLGLKKLAEIKKGMQEFDLVIDFSAQPLYLDGVEKTAISYPNETPKRLMISLAKWERLNQPMKEQLILHEYLLLLGVQDQDYYYSQRIWFFLTKYPDLLHRRTFDDYIMKKITTCDAAFFEELDNWKFDWISILLQRWPNIASEPHCSYLKDRFYVAKQLYRPVIFVNSSDSPLAFAIGKRIHALATLRTDLDSRYYLDKIESLLLYSAATENFPVFIYQDSLPIYMTALEYAIFSYIDSYKTSSGETVHIFDDMVVDLLISSITKDELRTFRTKQTKQTLLDFAILSRNAYAVEAIKKRLDLP